MGNCRCCKRDPNRPCKPCFLTQSWTTQFPPDKIITREDDSLLDSTGSPDATGDCDGFLDREHSHVWTYDVASQRNYPDAEKDEDGNRYPRTVTEDIQFPIPDYKTHNTSLIARNRLYPYIYEMVDRIQGNREYRLKVADWSGRFFTPVTNPSVNCSGYYYIPNSSIVGKSYSKTFDASFGADLHHQNTDGIYRDFPISVGGTTNDGRLQFTSFFAAFNTLFSQLWFRLEPSGDGRGVTSLELMDRKITLFRVGREDDGFGFIDLEMTFGDYVESGIQFRFVESSSTDSIETIECELTMLNTGKVYNWQKIIGNFQSSTRCARANASLSVSSNSMPASSSVYGLLDENLYDWLPPSNIEANVRRLVCSPIDMSWLYSTYDPSVLFHPVVSVGWIGLLSIDGTNSDTALFSCKQVDCYRHGSQKPYLSVFPNDGEFTIQDGTIIDIDAGFNDRYMVTFDNPTIQTTEVTNVNFQAPLVTAVDKTTEEFTGFERNTFEFTGPDPDGIFPPMGLTSSNLVWTHDQAGNTIPSPFTITLRSSKGVVPS
jgi:hypothetical protein